MQADFLELLTRKDVKESGQEGATDVVAAAGWVPSKQAAEGEREGSSC